MTNSEKAFHLTFFPILLHHLRACDVKWEKKKKKKSQNDFPTSKMKKNYLIYEEKEQDKGQTIK